MPRFPFRLVLRRPPKPAYQRRFAFLERAERLERRFKQVILALTATSLAGMLYATPTVRFALVQAARSAPTYLDRLIGMMPEHRDLEPALRLERAHTLDLTRKSLTRFYDRTTPEMRRLFLAIGMDPPHALVGTGRVDDGFVLSPQVYEADTHGRSYRLRPNVRSVWLRQITLLGGPLGLLLVRDTPEIRTACAAVGGIVEETSRQTTNSWGLRGPEPDTQAALRVLVLGDSMMQGMFIDDEHAPPLLLEHELGRLRQQRVSVLNTGHIGYSPEQYYHTLIEYGDRFAPHVVVVSVCPNDFGRDYDVDDDATSPRWQEPAYWLAEITQWCRSRRVPFLFVPVPCDYQIYSNRRDDRYPAPMARIAQGASRNLCILLDPFIDEQLRLIRESDRQNRPRPFKSVLHNNHIDDGHLSPSGSTLWARLVARRLDLILPDRTNEP